MQKMNDLRYKIGQVGISRTCLKMACAVINLRIRQKLPCYVCVTNVRTVYLSNRDENYCRIQNNSFLTVPDGMPLVWYARLAGLKYVEKTSGLDLMRSILSNSAEENCSHYFYGSTPGVIEGMVRNLAGDYPEMDIKKAYSPPFRPLTEEEIEQFADEINRLKPSFLWVGIGAPKQEFLMDKLIGRINSGTIMIGVGLAFDYLAGTVKRAPVWMRKSGLEWLYRCVQQPIRSRRFLKPLMWFFGVLFVAGCRRISFGVWESEESIKVPPC